jgi:multidrug resistance efflux pump
MVKKGDVLAEFDRLYMSIRVDDFEDSVVQHETRVRNLRALLKVQRTALEQRIRRAKAVMDKAALDLKTAPVRSAMQIERYRLALEEARARHGEYLKQLELMMISEEASITRWTLNLEQERVELRRAQRNYDRMHILAPMNGLVVLQKTWRGHEQTDIAPGDNVRPGHALMQVVDTRRIVVEGSVNQADAQLIHRGAQARVRLDAYPEQTFAGRVASIGNLASARGARIAYVREIPLVVTIEHKDGEVIPNYSASADVVLEEETDVSIAPRECVFTEPGEETAVAFVKNANGWEKREVELGLANHVEVAVRSGLAEGDVVSAERPPR